MLLLLQAGTVPGWVGTTVALSLLVIALAFVVMAAVAAISARQALRKVNQLSGVVESLRADLAPAVQSVKQLSGEGTRLAGLVSTEAEELVKATRRLRLGVEERVANLQAIYEVLEEEVEETAIDVSVTLRRFRQGTGWFALARRLLRSARRR